MIVTFIVLLQFQKCRCNVNIYVDTEIERGRAQAPNPTTYEAAAPSCGHMSTVADSDTAGGGGGQTGSFKREEARDRQPAPASLLSLHLY